MLRQFGDVAGPLAERRNLDLEGDQPEVQVLAELPLHHPLVQVLVRRRDHAEVAPHGPAGADGQNLAVFQHPQQFDLQRGRDVGHLVEEERAAVGLFQQALAGLLGPGERPADVAEQLALGQRRAERGDVDRHERPAAPPAVLMDRPGHQFLAGAALAADVDAGLGRGDDRNPLEDLLDGRRRADNRRGRRWLSARNIRAEAVFRQAGTSVPFVRGGRPASERPLDRPLGHAQVERLDQILEGPVADGLDRGGQVAVGGDHNHRHGAAEVAEPLHGRQSIQARQADVQDDRVGGLFLRRFKRLLRRGGDRRRMAQALDQFAAGPNRCSARHRQSVRVP